MNLEEPSNSSKISKLTTILGRGNDLTQQFREIWQIFAEELGLDNEGFSGVVGSQLASQQLCLSGNSQCGSFLGGLTGDGRQPMAFQELVMMMGTYLECELLQTSCQTGRGLVSRSSFGDNGELCRRTCDVSAGHLDSSNIRRLVRERGCAGDCCCETAAVCWCLSTALPAKGMLCVSSNRRP